jgi:hypothetical protein
MNFVSGSVDCERVILVYEQKETRTSFMNVEEL